MSKTLVCQNCNESFQIIGNHEQNQEVFQTLCRKCRDKALEK